MPNTRSCIARICIISAFSLFMLWVPKPALQSSGFQEAVTAFEQEILEQINGQSIWDYDRQLEQIAARHLAFRSSGSAGADAAADWIARKLQSFGLQVTRESFPFETWDLLDPPTMILDADGNPRTLGDQTPIPSFRAAHRSTATPRSGIFAELVVLPLPSGIPSREALGRSRLIPSWDGINTRGKIVLVGREVKWNDRWFQIYQEKISRQRPAAVVFTWWYEWMSFAPPMFDSSGGLRPPHKGIPLGWISYEDGLRLRSMAPGVFAKIVINAATRQELHDNIVGQLTGRDPTKKIIISAHYDTVVAPGFCDNGAGTAAMLELARVFSEAKRRSLYTPPYTFLFIAFADEEFWLIGSYYYVIRHRHELEDIVGVINIDGIGSDKLAILPSSSSHLDDLAARVASDLDISTVVFEEAGSDHVLFDNPEQAEGWIHWLYGRLPSGSIRDQPPRPGITLGSIPRRIDLDPLSTPGWGHTAWDSSQTSRWVEVTDLEAHTRVAALTVLRLSAQRGDPYADRVVGFSPGEGANPDFDDPGAALGPPDFEVDPPKGFVNLGIGGTITLEFTTTKSSTAPGLTCAFGAIRRTMSGLKSSSA